MAMQRRTFCVLGMIACCMPALLGRPDRQALASAGNANLQEAVAPTIPAEYLAAVLAGAGCQTMFDGDSRLSASGRDRYRGNAFSITLESQLREFSMELRLSRDTDLHFSVFRVLTPPAGNPRGPFCPVFVGEPIPASPAGPPGAPVKAFYSSGVFSPPLTLEAGYDYALAVAWGVEDVTYFKQPVDAPPFPRPLVGNDGQILGSVAQNGLTLPLDPDPFACLPLTPFRSTVYSMEICLEPQPGACCLGSVCDELKPEDCLATPGNVFTRERLTCADLMDPDVENLDCPLPVVACCIPGTGCVPLDKFTCEANLGTLPGGLCTDVPDPCAPKGACCQDRGVCDTVIEADCDLLGGVYRGDGTTCSTIDPSCSFGACCVGASCLPLTLSNCAGTAGAWQGHGTLCAGDGSTCDPRGACCDGVGGCQDGLDGMTGAVCTASGGSYKGDWSTCGTLDVPCQKGACCTPRFGCLPNLDQSFCEGAPLLGTYMGDETSCGDQATQCPGTCCLFGSCLPNTTPAECGSLTGADFAGYGLCCPSGNPGDLCVDDPCAALAPTEACCLPDGSCMDVSAAEVCSKILDATAGGVGTDCAGTTCPGPAPKGACCLTNGLCSELTEADCIADSGIYDGDATTCTLGSCGVCCQADGTCDDTVNVIFCSLGNGLFFPGSDCASAPCPSVGACCVAGQPCDDLIIGHACGRKGGFFEGEGVACGPVDPCIPTACCHDDGTCTTATPSQCAAVFGTTDPGADCSQGLCPPPIACCHDDGTCTMITEAACTDAGGTPDSDPLSFCGVDDSCPAAGACCTPDESCADITEQACTAGLGGVWNPSIVCTSSTDSRCTLGSCCRMDGSCNDVVAFACADIGDDFAPGACGDRTCVPTGACCNAGDCTDAVSQQDCQPDGCYEGDGTFCDISGLCSTGATGFSIVDAVPPSGSVDARIPHAIDNAAALLGWDSVEFSVDVASDQICKTSFQMIEAGGDGTPPEILDVTPTLGKIRLTLSEPIEASSWIMISHVNSADVYCLGAQPGDVDKDGTTDISDVGALIACLNPPTHCGGVMTGTVCTSDADCTVPDTCDPVPCDPVRCDIDRGGICTGADLPMLINLLNGAGAYISWDGQTLMPSPCP